MMFSREFRVSIIAHSVYVSVVSNVVCLFVFIPRAVVLFKPSLMHRRKCLLGRIRKVLQFLLIIAATIFIPLHFLSVTSSSISEPFQADHDAENNVSPNTSFIEVMQSFPLRELKQAVAEGQVERVAAIYGHLLRILTRWIIKEPLVPINETCKPPRLATQDEIICHRHHTAFNRTKRKSPAKIAVAFTSNFDVDILEIRLNELFDVADVFFFLEPRKTFLYPVPTSRPSIWQQVKEQTRFSKFSDKIIHFFDDDIPLGPFVLEDLKSVPQWYLENRSRVLLRNKISQWNERHGNFFHKDDIIVFGDVDEIPSRDNINLFRYCIPKGPVVDIGSWFAFGKIDKAFPPPFIVPGHPFAYSNPPVYLFSEAMRVQPFPTHDGDPRRPFLLGSIHMTDNGYLPFLLLKWVFCSECSSKWAGPRSTEALYKVFREDLIAVGNVRKWERLAGDRVKEFIAKPVPVKDLISNELAGIYYVPWFFQCNPKRFPTWYGLHDTRLD